ncbi:MAG: SsrA-binding protein SmpB [Chloroflexi bacterium]|nr:MAG: SsrA-binding protein SmpB [Chloroflexota bacterium]TMB94042.1 MAG: SsrA-binding protein SmpB [Chloroflexota bacterium]TMC30559.1 MAG: SsrA-binding protein SmpB [Chloroflexota bacterium]TMC33166.1 MAG: SsrA-binding protein SmpB [Chloroflexota bacterium]TMC55847.1 MAG: SsrA-binding protein SmpB [Chloroflexota bacterium]
MRERARGTPAAPEKKSRDVQLADNRRAFYDYSIGDKIEAGIALTGTEIKSLRAGHVNLRDGFVRIENGEAWLRGVHISPWTHTGHDNHEPLRSRKLLLHKSEIAFLARGASEKGYTVVPLRLYTKQGRAKVELGLARGKRRYEKRQVIKEREAQREMDAAIRRRVPRA